MGLTKRPPHLYIPPTAVAEYADGHGCWNYNNFDTPCRLPRHHRYHTGAATLEDVDGLLANGEISPTQAEKLRMWLSVYPRDRASQAVIAAGIAVANTLTGRADLSPTELALTAAVTKWKAIHK